MTDESLCLLFGVLAALFGLVKLVALVRKIEPGLLLLPSSVERLCGWHGFEFSRDAWTLGYWLILWD